MNGFVKPMLVAIVVSIIVAIIVYMMVWTIAGPWDSAGFKIVIVISAIVMGGLIMGIVIELRRLGWLKWNV